MADLFGTKENNILRGTRSDDKATLFKGDGYAYLYGGNDAAWATTTGNHTIGLGDGNDSGILTGKGIKIGFFGKGNDEGWLNVGVAYMGDGDDFLTFVNKFNTTSRGNLGHGNDQVWGSNGAQIIGCGPSGKKILDLKGGGDIVYSNNADVVAKLGAGKDIFFVGEKGTKEILDFAAKEDQFIFKAKADNVKIWDNEGSERDVVEIKNEFGFVTRAFVDDVARIADILDIDLNDHGFGELTSSITATKLNDAFRPEVF